MKATMRFDAVRELMVNRAQLQIVFQVSECRLDLGKLEVELPQLSGIVPAQMGTK